MKDITRPLVVRIESAMPCNHNCFYCYNPTERKELPIVLAKERIRDLVALVASWGTFDLTFTGGEPFINKEVLYEGIAAVKKTNMDFGINTNATLITEEDARRLKDCGVASVFASFPCYKKDKFEAATRIPGSYERACAGFKNLSKYGIRVSANMVVTKNPVQNIEDVYETGKMLYEKFGILRFCTAPISPSYQEQTQHIVSVSDIEKIFEQMVRVSEDFGIDIRNSRPLPICFLEGMDPKFAKYDLFRGCTIGVVNGMTLTLNGDLKCCPVMNTPIANAFNDSLGEIMRIMAKFDGRDAEAFQKIVPSECLDCAILDICKGGCKTEALAMGANIKTRSRYKKNIQKDLSLVRKVMADRDLVNGKRYSIRKSIKWREDPDEMFVIRAEKFALLNKQEFGLFQYLYTLDDFNPLTLIQLHSLNKEKLNLFLNKLDKAKALLEG